MNAMPHDRGLSLLAAHCLSLDPSARTARQRLDAAIGPELAHMLVFALSRDESESTSRWRNGLGTRAVFAA
jgi:hypothetical protein